MEISLYKIAPTWPHKDTQQEKRNALNAPSNPLTTSFASFYYCWYHFLLNKIQKTITRKDTQKRENKQALNAIVCYVLAIVGTIFPSTNTLEIPKMAQTRHPKRQKQALNAP